MAPPSCGAGDGNRTRITSLEGWGSTIELHPRAWCPGRRAGSLADRRRTPRGAPDPVVDQRGGGGRDPVDGVGARSGSRPPPGPRRALCSSGTGRRCGRGVAQFGSALALGARGRGFKSRHPDGQGPRSVERRTAGLLSFPPACWRRHRPPSRTGRSPDSPLGGACPLAEPPLDIAAARGPRGGTGWPRPRRGGRPRERAARGSGGASPGWPHASARSVRLVLARQANAAGRRVPCPGRTRETRWVRHAE